MFANAWRCWLGSFLLACAVPGVATCGDGPTTIDPTPTPTPTPTPQPTVIPCTAAQSIQRFSVDPANVTEGDAFTLRWEAPCGYVSLAQKGKAQFAFNQASTGSYQLRSGANGYPTATGDTVYEAANGDLATRVYATVTVTARATPTPAPTPTPVRAAPTISLSGAASCYPVRAGNAGCDVAITATASNYSSIAWSGCCAGSSGTIGTCHVSNLSTFTCTASATGSGGSAQADKPVAGTNAAPVLGAMYRSHHYADCDTVVTFEFTMIDEEAIWGCGMVDVFNACTFESSECPVAGWPKLIRVKGHTMLPPQPSSALCHVQIKARDPWGVESEKILL